jgi:uncharacterized protein
MPQRAETNGAPCWVELSTSDAEKATAFYGALFGWTGEASAEFGGYINFQREGQPVAGCMASDGSAGPTDLWSVYLQTDDAEKTTETATAHGGQVVVPPMPVGDLGTMAFVTDAGGGNIGLWQPGQHRGTAVVAEPGAPAWFELHTRDYDASVAFYRDVFGWDAHVASDTPEFRYTTLGEGDDEKAGIMDAAAFLPEGVPAHWSVYFAVPDADAALAQVVELGGSIVQPAEDTPYGRLAEAADPNGARFKLVAG